MSAEPTIPAPSWCRCVGLWVCHEHRKLGWTPTPTEEGEVGREALITAIIDRNAEYMGGGQASFGRAAVRLMIADALSAPNETDKLREALEPPAAADWSHSHVAECDAFAGKGCNCVDGPHPTSDDPATLLSRAREYVADALDAHEHSDGRDLLTRIDAICDMNNCRNRAPADEPFCNKHRGPSNRSGKQ